MKMQVDIMKVLLCTLPHVQYNIIMFNKDYVATFEDVCYYKFRHHEYMTVKRS